MDLTASVAVPISNMQAGSVFEIGVAYSRLFNVMDATNDNTDSADSFPTSRPLGSSDDDIDALSLFFLVFKSRYRIKLSLVEPVA